MSPELRLHGAEWEQGELPEEKGHTNPDEPQCLSENKLSRAENCSLKGKCDLQMLTEQRAVPLLPPASCCYSDSGSSPFRSPDTFWESADAGVGTSNGVAKVQGQSPPGTSPALLPEQPLQQPQPRHMSCLYLSTSPNPPTHVPLNLHSVKYPRIPDWLGL